MNSTLNISLNNEDKLFYNNYFNEDDQKSRLFEDTKNDLIAKLTVSIMYKFYIYIIIFKNLKN